jgi:MoaA/NifB/PqqE/SkfB family radical SAM enzyme
MDLAAGTENIRVWQKPWYALRIHLASGPGCEIIIYDLFVRGWLEEVSNEKINLYECSNLPLSMESKPVLVYAELCTFCNMRCRMCGRTVHGVKGPDQGMMKKEVFERLAEIFSPGGSLALFGRGETLMHPDFPYILKLAKEKGMKVTFNSNGKALTEKIVRAMVEYGQDSITISCSAGKPENYEEIHCGGKWNQLWENIACLQKLKEQFGSGRPSIYIEFVSQMDNISELPRLIRRAIKYKLTGVIVIDIVAHSDELEKQRMNMPETLPIAEKYYKQALEVVNELRSKSPHFELRLPSSYNALTKKFSSGETEERLKNLGKGFEQNANCFADKKMCLEPWQTFYVRFDGTIAPCVITNRNLGDFNVQGALEIWNGPEFQKFRSRMRSENKPFECLRCHLFPGPQRYDKALGNVEEYEAL